MAPSVVLSDAGLSCACFHPRSLPSPHATSILSFSFLTRQCGPILQYFLSLRPTLGWFPSPIRLLSPPTAGCVHQQPISYLRKFIIALTYICPFLRLSSLRVFIENYNPVYSFRGHSERRKQLQYGSWRALHAAIPDSADERAAKSVPSQ